MKKQVGFTAALCIVFAGFCCAAPSPATAQEQANGISHPPKVLVIQREFLKPGEAGSVHEKSEQAFVQAMKQANSKTHYIAVNSLTGKSRTLFLIGYNSFADWQKDVTEMASNSALGQAMDSATEADGKLLSSSDAGVFVFQPDKSVSPGFHIGQVRYWEIASLRVRVGHDDDWDALAKLHDQIFGNMPDAHWVMFEEAFGHDSSSLYIVFRGMHSLAELDKFHAQAKQAWNAASADQKKRMNDLEASTLESIEMNLFAVDPKMSYAADNWRNADPGFWGQQ